MYPPPPHTHTHTITGRILHTSDYKTDNESVLKMIIKFYKNEPSYTMTPPVLLQLDSRKV